MMTSKQKWFIGKLIKELEDMGCKVDSGDTLYGSKGYDTYRTSKKEASEDISMLLNIKEQVESGTSYEEAMSNYLEEKYR